MADTRTLAETYFSAWRSKDFQTLRSILADDATFTGPLGTADDAEGCVRGLRGLAGMTTDIVIKAMVADGDNVITWYDLHTEGHDPIPTANWSHAENGLIKTIRATFDPRPLLA